MNIIIPMAGMGKRMRPHTLTTAKPLIPVAGKSIVAHLCEDIIGVVGAKASQISFIIGENFGAAVEQELLDIASGLGAKGLIRYQKEPLGTAHAVMCAADELQGDVIIAFADTLFKADFVIDSSKDGMIWVQKIEDPSAFGVVKLDSDGNITDFVEKPQEFVSDLAIIGIYYFKEGEVLRRELQYLLDNDIREKGEYQLTNALENMKSKGMKFAPATVEQWLDCGNKDATVATNTQVLKNKYPQGFVAATAQVVNSTIIQPCYIGEGVRIVNSVVGPHVTLHNKTQVEFSCIKNSIVRDEAIILNSCIDNSLIGKNASIKSKPQDLSISDYSTIV